VLFLQTGTFLNHQQINISRCMLLKTIRGFEKRRNLGIVGVNRPPQICWYCAKKRRLLVARSVWPNNCGQPNRFQHNPHTTRLG